MQFVKILLRDEMGIDKTELYKVYKKSDTNVKTTEKKLYTLSTEKPALQGG